MNGIDVVRLIVEEPAHGAWNMAVDEALLQAAVAENVATLRFYEWSEPTLSLGYFQRYGDRRQHAASRECAVVRRQSGGGAILHDRELTYSLAIPAGHPMTRDAARLYVTIHEAFLRILTPRLESAGVDSRLRINCTDSPLAAGEEPFLCFQRRARGDLLLEPEHELPPTKPAQLAYKILGSAQRRHRGAILQHGSLLLEQSPVAPELLGWRELAGEMPSWTSLAAEFRQQLAALMATGTIEGRLPAATFDAARGIEKAKYSDRSWTERR